MIAAFSELAGSMSPRTSRSCCRFLRPAPAEVADPAEIADAAAARALAAVACRRATGAQGFWPQSRASIPERANPCPAGASLRRLMARQNTKLNQGEQLVLDGWLERIYAEGGVAESDGQLAARLKRQFVAFERSQWEARAARRKAMADSEGADGRVVVEANESDLDAQAKMEWVRRRRAEAELSLARRRSLASLSDGRYVEDPRLVKERWLMKMADARKYGEATMVGGETAARAHDGSARSNSASSRTPRCSPRSSTRWSTEARCPRAAAATRSATRTRRSCST